MTPATTAPTIGQKLVERLLAVTRQQRDGEAPAVALLIPDPDRAWALVAPHLIEQGEPAMVLSEEHRPKDGAGPAAWIRTMIDSDAEQRPWIVVLPGVLPSELESKSATPFTKLLVDLHYRGRMLATTNGQHIRFADFLRDSTEGLGLDLRDDLETQDALQSAIRTLLSRPVEDFEGRRFGATRLRELTLDNAVARLLDWINSPDANQEKFETSGIWDSFTKLCSSTYEFDPDVDGHLTAAVRLAQGKRAWSQVWDSFCDKAAKLPGVVAALEQVPATAETHAHSLPGENRRLEADLAAALRHLKDSGQAEAQAQIIELEQMHCERRAWVWSELGQAPLAAALEHLAAIAKAPKPAGDIDSWWTSEGWRVDDSALRALAACNGDDDRYAVTAALRTLYLPWLDDTARRLQQYAERDVALGSLPPTLTVEDGTCVMFVDGLRGDIAHRLQTQLGDAVKSTIKWRFAPLPSITTCGKLAVVPMRLELEAGAKFELNFVGGAPVKAPSIRKALEADGWQIVDPNNPTTLATGKGWCELTRASIDDLGHNTGDRFAESLPALLHDIASSVHRLIGAGWTKVTIVTDHGFLFLPGGFPKVELPQHLAKSRKPRCARLNDGVPSQSVERPWAWSREERVAFPPGVGVYEAGSGYEHGGISLQECIVPTILVSGSTSTRPADTSLDVSWKGFRCIVSAPGMAATAGTGAVTVDLRRAPKDPATSVAIRPVQLDEDGEAKIKFDDDSIGTQQPEDVQLWLVLIAESGTLLAQRQTRVGT